MKQFPSFQKIDTAILYVLELISIISVLLLALGLIALMANVLTKGSVLASNLIMQRIWAWTQCIAIDASVAGAIIRTCCLTQYKHWYYLGQDSNIAGKDLIFSMILRTIYQTVNSRVVFLSY